MEKERNVREEADNSRLMTKLAIIGGVGSIFLVILILILGTWAGSNVFSLSILPYTLAAIFAVAAMIYGIMNASATGEEEEKKLLEKRKEGMSAFNIEEDVRFTAGRSFENYKKFAPYALALIAAIVSAVIIVLFVREWTVRMAMPVPKNVLHAAFVAAIMMIISVFAGAFFIGQARAATFRWLRPLGAWLIAGFVVSMLCMLSLLLNHIGYPKADYYIARVVLVAFGILTVELIINFVVEFYRPRTLEEPRPVFESRLLALFTEPGGVMRNIADTLDYQFGFKVSGTWIYAFMEKSLFPLLIIWLVVLWMFTGISEVGPGEVGVREHFGKIVSEKLLPPGIYYTYPYPFGNIARYSCSKIHSVNIGSKMVDETGKSYTSEVVLWTNKHFAQEGDFLVASEKEDKSETPATTVSFLGLTMPVQYQIEKRGLFDYAYKNNDSAKILQRLGEMVATQYFASVSIMKIMSYERHKAESDIMNLIQAAANQRKLGVKIVAVNLLDAHPPIEKVAPAFQNVIGSIEEKETEILKAKVYRENVLPNIQTEQMRIIAEANSYSYNVVTVSKAEGERFNKQLQAYEVMPALYILKSTLDLLEKDCKDIRKYIISASVPHEVYELNFEQKARLDLIDSDLGSITQKK
ncbi:MAG: SPFH domain-containing protein [Victivallaceae bacterium]